MGVVPQERIDSLRSLCQRKVLKTNPRGGRTECFFSDGTFILVSNFLASFIRAGDDLLFSLEPEAVASRTEIYIRNSNPHDNRRSVLQTCVGYASQPRKDKRNNFFISAEVLNPQLGISAICLPNEALRDYFYVGNRNCVWGRQPSLYKVLQASHNASPAELRLAFKLRTLEVRTAKASPSNPAALERAFNILARPELRACYDALLNDPDSPALFPYGGFGSLIAAGDLLRDGSTFYASRILSFLPEQKFKHFRAPLRRVVFHSDHAIYRDSRCKLEILFDQASLPMLWDSSWNPWKHLLGAMISVKATFVQSGKYHYRGGAWHLDQWESALPSRIEVGLPSNIAEQIADARKTHHRFGQFAEAFDQIRSRIESTPVETAELRRLCAMLGIADDFDVALITWRSDYDAFYYKHLCKRARRLYLFRSEYIFDLERAVIVETPQLGHATYLFSKPVSMTEFLAIYTSVTKDDVRYNRGNATERLGFLGRLVHGHNPGVWLKELKTRLGETVEYAEVTVG